MEWRNLKSWEPQKLEVIICTILLILILSRIALAQESIKLSSEFTGFWRGQEYKTKGTPPNEIIDLVKEKIISLGISEKYFDEHFKLVYASISRWSTEKGWQGIGIDWNYTVNEYSLKYFVRVENVTEGLAFDPPFDIVHLNGTRVYALHEIKETISREEAENKLKTCPKKYWSSAFGFLALTQSGNLFLYADGPAGVAKVNLETGELSCEKHRAKAEVGFSFRGIMPPFYVIIGIGILGLIFIIYFLIKRQKMEKRFSLHIFCT